MTVTYTDNKLISIGVTVDQLLVLGDATKAVVHSYHPNPEYDQTLVYSNPVFTSSDDTIVTIVADAQDPNVAIVTAVADGNATITATIGTVSVSSQMHVSQPTTESTTYEVSHELATGSGDPIESIVNGSAYTPVITRVEGSPRPYKLISKNTSILVVLPDNTVKSVGSGIGELELIGAGIVSNTLFVEVTPYSSLLGFELEVTPSTLVIGKTARASAERLQFHGPSESLDPTFSSSDDSVLTVDSSTGIITPVSPGYAYVQCVVGGLVQSAQVIVSTPVLQSIKIGLVDSIQTVIIREQLPDGSNIKPSFLSSNEVVVRVTSQGKLVPISNGSATITVRDATTGVRATIDVVVDKSKVPAISAPSDEPILFSFEMSSPAANLAISDTYQITVINVEEHGADTSSIVFESSDPSVTVDAAGLLTAVSEGSATITGTVGDISTTIDVVVDPAAPVE